MKSFLKLVGLSSAGLAIYLYSKKETPQEFFNNLKNEFLVKKEQVYSVKDAKENFTNSLANFKQQLPAINKVSNELKRDIDEFTFMIEPRIEEINKYIEDLNKKI